MEDFDPLYPGGIDVRRDNDLDDIMKNETTPLLDETMKPIPKG